ncbi:scavenger receptor cysteine-rich domain-containing protein DMBT1-like [Centroberyx affinis]|uniref:scavenger receptor cysteine-rich domain-containing protein DMBT1-like n=1 Tax=Centroberyx affinis TaxID=166261 RepID=UPI003A5C314F
MRAAVVIQHTGGNSIRDETKASTDDHCTAPESEKGERNQLHTKTIQSAKHIQLGTASGMGPSSEGANVRLVNGDGPCSGRVEIYHRGQWGTVCDNGWDIPDAKVVCRQLHCGKALDVKAQAYFGEGSGEIWMSSVKCSGSEGTLTQCRHRRAGTIDCGHREDAGVICSGTVRLVNGTDSCSGRVEVYYDGRWGTVCDDDWDTDDAQVVCKELGCGRALGVKHRAHYGEGSGDIWMSDVKCSGVEESLALCLHSDSAAHSCGHNQDAGVFCSESVKVRLVNGTNRCSGRVEVYYNGQWGTVCSNDWDINDAEVVCRQLRCGKALDFKNQAFFGEGSGEIWMSGVNCSGDEDSVAYCRHIRAGSHSCSHDADAGVVCSGPVRLVNGTSHCSGRVEVYYNDEWGTVCGDDWGMEDAEVVCRQLSCGRALRAKNLAYFGEENIEVRLVNGTSHCSGVVEVFYRGQRRRVCSFNREWGDTVCGLNKDNAGGAICRHLGCGSAISVYRSSLSSMEGRNLSSLNIFCGTISRNLTQCSVSGFDCSAFNYSVGVKCSASIRLVDGPDRCSGRVEVNHDGRWGTVCDDDWDLEDAQVVCREMECGTAQSAKRGAYFGAGTGDIWMNKLKCSGAEVLLKECSHRGFRRHDCGHHQDAGVVCSGAVRLVNGTDRCSGRVEVYIHGQWGTVCGKDWDMMEAQVVCPELGCGTALDYKNYSFFGEGSGDIFMSGFISHWQLIKYEKKNIIPHSLTRSAHTFSLNIDGSIVTPSTQVRNLGIILDPTLSFLPHVNQVTKTAFFHLRNIARLRPSLSFAAAETLIHALITSRLDYCNSILYGSSNKILNKLQYVQNSAARLLTSTHRRDHITPVLHNLHWLPVKYRIEFKILLITYKAINNLAPPYLSDLVPRHTPTRCLRSAATTTLKTTRTKLRTWGDRAFSVAAPSLWNALPNHIQSVKVRAADGPDVCTGRVEVYSKGQWGTVCDDGWDLSEADVVCRELGCGLALEVKLGAFYGPGSGDILMTDVNCTGSEDSLNKCPHSRLGKQKCGHHEDAGVVCEEFIKTRLVEGSADGCFGKVEVFSRGQWGTVIAFAWYMKESEVVCREIGCSKAKESYGKSSQNNGEFRIRDVTCTGEELSVIHCPHRREKLEGDRYTMVSCSGPVRLVSGTDECSGRVEVYKYGKWGTVCDDDWDMKEAEVVCRQLKCGTVVYVKYGAHFGQGSGEIWMSGVNCTGLEGSLTHCHHKHHGLHSCGHNKDAGVVCSRSIHVRLVNGRDRCSGRVEVYYGSWWGRVDDHGWDLKDSKVVCRELGCGKALEAKNNSYFGQGSGEIWMTDVKCSGPEPSLFQCSHLRPETWTNRQDAGVVCSGKSEVRLVNGSSRCSGRVEVYHGAVWIPLCDHNWDLNDGHVICRYLDCGEAVTTQHNFGQGDSRTRLEVPRCSGDESSITQCTNNRKRIYSCNNRRDAGLICSGQVRLVNGHDQCSGRVEVYRGGRWGTVCHDDWDTRDAEVVCRELGCGRPLHVTDQSYFGEGGGEVLLAGLRCSGSEDSFHQCPHDQSGPRNCGHHQDVGVICTESVKVRLVSGSDRCSGRVEVYYNGQWGSVCGDDWDMKDAEVVCREVVCGRAQSVGDDYGQGSGQHWLDGLECLGNESSLTQCSHKGFGRHECGQTVDAAVSCAG